MPFLTLAGTDYKVTSFRWSDPERRGEDVRAFAGNLLLGSDTAKRTGSGELWPLPAADLVALRGLADAGTVAVGGDVLQGVGGTFRVRISGEEAGPARVSTGANSYRDDWSQTHWTATITLTEV